MGKYYIHDFCEELNYQGIILYIHEEIDFQDLYKKTGKRPCESFISF